MIINENERIAATKLINELLKNKEKLPYINIGSNNEYLGWVADFKLKHSNNTSICLDLKKENDMFLLFILAIIWSRTGVWENSAFFVSYLKIYEKDSVDFWLNLDNCLKEKEIREKSAVKIFSALKCHTPPRKKISFRKDIFTSINILAYNWQRILSKLEVSEKEQDFKIFMKYMRSIEGLGVGSRRILIKIPLLLREMRCQKIYNNISGDLCCVADERVVQAGKFLGLSIIKPTDLQSLTESSTKIYRLFGDLYDLPLFAHSDLKTMY